MAQNWYGNMGPFGVEPSIKGNAHIHGVPTFIKELPLTKGGIAGEDLPFGRVVSIIPSANRRQFKLGVPTGGIVQGLVILSPTRMIADPAMNNKYFAGQPMTITTMGLVDILEYDTDQLAPMEGSTVWCRNDNGMLAFNDGTDISSSGYTKLNAFVYESLDPNGAKVWFGIPFAVGSLTRETVEKVATPVATPAAGAVAANTEVALTCATPGASIYYTVDGSAPSSASTKYTAKIKLTAAATIKAIAILDTTSPDVALDPSAVLSATYTIS